MKKSASADAADAAHIADNGNIADSGHNADNADSADKNKPIADKGNAADIAHIADAADTADKTAVRDAANCPSNYAPTKSDAIVGPEIQFTESRADFYFDNVLSCAGYCERSAGNFAKNDPVPETLAACHPTERARSAIQRLSPPLRAFKAFL